MRTSRDVKLDAIATQTHFVDHLAPVWLALPEEARGTLYIRDRDHAGLPNATREQIPKSRNPTLTASAGDLAWSRRIGRPTAIMEHGCGQSFGGGPRPRNHSSYAGGTSRDAQLFLHPGPHPAARDRAVHPDARIEIVGCPKLDGLPRKPERSSPPVVAVSFHWNCSVVPETKWALPDFRRHVPNLAETGLYEVIGHGHPRASDRLKHWFMEHGIEWVPTFAEVCRRADVYVNDASSTLFEFAATGRPVVVMNPDHYRRNVIHGLRFWEAATVGVQATPKTGLIDPVAEALRDKAAQRAAREKALDLVYAYRDGAAERAAAVLLDWAGA
jgi:hypothetical protein